MCNVNCCCRAESTNGLIKLLLLFTGINLLLSIAAIFIRAANTKRYDEALIYLEAINNGTFKEVTFEDPQIRGRDVLCEETQVTPGRITLRPYQAVWLCGK